MKSTVSKRGENAPDYRLKDGIRSKYSLKRYRAFLTKQDIYILGSFPISTSKIRINRTVFEKPTINVVTMWANLGQSENVKCLSAI